ncbi:MAG: hypothetical protein ACPGXK_05975 [Phycisphaerae bacterium]
MRIAVLNVGLPTHGRSAEYQALHRAMRASLDQRPAPELIVVPPVEEQEPRGGHLEPHLQTTLAVESIAWIAKEWGVYVLAAVTHMKGDEVQPALLLIDPDGDIRGNSLRPDTRRNADDRAEQPKHEETYRFDTEYGAILVTTDINHAVAYAEGDCEGTLVAVPLWPDTDGKKAEQQGQLLEQLLVDQKSRRGADWLLAGRHPRTRESLVVHLTPSNVLVNENGHQLDTIETEAAIG